MKLLSAVADGEDFGHACSCIDNESQILAGGIEPP